jgi:xylulose-5-phosphate/fructose-6-phosphate phosphoketolase
VGDRRMGANPIANGGLLRRELRMPDFRDYAVDIPKPASVEAENTRPLGAFLRDVMRNNMTNFRLFGPDETASNRLTAVYEASKKMWLAEMLPEDLDGSELSTDGRVMEMLSEHTLLGWMEGYLLSGRHGFFHTYEAFAHVIDSMFNQHAKWLNICKNEVPWRAPVSSWNVLLSSTVWRQDHNGFSHQDPGFVDLVTNKSADVVRIYFPPDANCLLSVADHCLRSTDYTNIIVSDKQKHLQYLSMEEAVKQLPFWAVHIFQPSVLLGERNENRWGEAIAGKLGKLIDAATGGLLKKYRPVEADVVARAMVSAAQRLEPGIHVYPSHWLQELAEAIDRQTR